MTLIIQSPPVSEGSLRALATEIRKDLYGGGPVPDDARIALRQIEMIIRRIYNEVVTALDEAGFKKGQMPDMRRLQRYSCLPLIPTADIVCGCTRYEWDVLEVKLPRLYMWRGSQFISYFGLPDRQTPFIKTASLEELNTHADYSAKPAYLLAEDKAFVIRPPRLALMCDAFLWAIPEDPTDTVGKVCFDVWSAGWPVTPLIKEAIKSKIIGTYGRVILATQGQRDERNNGADGNYRSSILKD